MLAEPLVQLVQCPFVALEDALCIRRAAVDAVLQIQLSEIEQHDNWLAILANEAKQKRLLLVQPRQGRALQLAIVPSDAHCG